MEKVYLAKSNRANPDDVLKVRGILSSSNVEIIEYTGGAFSHEPMLTCGMLIVVPDLNRYVKDGGYDGEDVDIVGVGKGLYEQVMTFIEHADGEVLVVRGNSDLGPLMSAINEDVGEVDDPYDYIDYGWLLLDPIDDEHGGLSQILKNYHGSSKDGCDTTTSPSNSRRYLLIGK